MAEREFRLPGSPYEELVNIVIAYGTRDDATRSGDVSKLDSAHQTSVSRNNAFLTEIGVLEGESKKLITRRGRSLALALARKDPEEIRKNWRGVVSGSEFLQNVVSAVKMREEMLYPTLQAYVAHAARQPRNKPVMTGAGAIVEILKAAGLLREEAGELVAVFEEEPPIEDLPPPDGPTSTDGLPEPEVSESSEPTLSATVEARSNPVLNVHLHVRCTPDEIEDLAPKLKALLSELSAEGVREGNGPRPYRPHF